MNSDDEFDLEKIRASNVSEIQNMFGDVFVEAEILANQLNDDLKLLSSHRIRRRKEDKEDDRVLEIRKSKRLSAKMKRARKKERSSSPISIPDYSTERRLSARLSKRNPEYTYKDLEKILLNHMKDEDYEFENMDELDEIFPKSSKKRKMLLDEMCLSKRV